MSYNFWYYAAIIVAVIGVIAGVVGGIGYTGLRPGWDTPDVAGTAGMVAAICVGVAALLPQLTHTPAARETAYLKAAATGELPKDLKTKQAGVHGTG